MGIVSVSDLNRLFWAGRYCQRALSLYERFVALPADWGVRRDFGLKMGLMPDIGTRQDGFSDESCDKNGQLMRGIVLPETVVFDAVAVSAAAWSDNVYMLRHLLGTKAVMTAEAAAEKAGVGDFDMLPLYAYAFFGMADSRLTEPTARATVAAGRMSEQLDILSRVGEETFLLRDALERLNEAVKESAAVENMIGRCALSLIEEDLRSGNAAAVSAHTELLESNNEYS